jgi:hypothetical protein
MYFEKQYRKIASARIIFKVRKKYYNELLLQVAGEVKEGVEEEVVPSCHSTICRYLIGFCSPTLHQVLGNPEPLRKPSSDQLRVRKWKELRESFLFLLVF